MPSDQLPELDEVDEVLDGLSSPTSRQVFDAMQPYNNDIVAAGLGSRAMAAGGGGGTVPFVGDDPPPDPDDGDLWWDTDDETDVSGGSQSVYEVVHVFTPSELMNLTTTQIELVPNPGPEKAIVPFLMSTYYEAGNTPYGDAGYLMIGTPSNIAEDSEVLYLPFTENFTKADDYWGMLTISGAGTWDTLYPNEALVAGNNGAAITDGDGTVTVKVLYTLIEEQ